MIKSVLINIKGIDKKENLDFIKLDYINKYVTKEAILELNNRLTQYFLDRDYLLPQITINEKALRKGILNVDVQIATLKDVVIIGESNSLLQAYANKILAVKPSSVTTTQRYLALINKIPDYKSAHFLRRDMLDKNLGVDLLLMTEKHKGEVFVNVDNYGLNDFGKLKAMVVGQVFSSFKDGDSLSLLGLTTNHPDRLYAVSLHYKMPINEFGTNIRFSASRSEDNSAKNKPFNTPNNTQNNFGLTASHPLYITASKRLKLRVGTHFQDISNYGLITANTAAKTDYVKYWFLKLGLEYLFKDKFQGHNLLSLNFVQGLGGKIKKYYSGHTNADKNFNFISFNAYKDQPLPNNFSIFLHFSAKYSKSNLPSSELFTLGGRSFGRGYPFYTLAGDNMVGLALEARYRKNVNYKLLEKIEPYIFIDTGYMGGQNANTNISHLSSAGAGLRFKLPQSIELGLELAQPFRKNYNVDGVALKGTTKFGIFINKVFKF